jgi:hypothetical protein
VRRVVPVLVLALCGAATLLAAGCGRSLPEEAAETVPEGGDPTGAFGEGGEGLEGTIRVAGAGSGVKLVKLAAGAFREEEPGVEVSARAAPVDEAVAGVCAGRLDVAVADRPLASAERSACESKAEGAVELHLADGPGGRPVTLVTTNAVLFERFEVEGLLQFVLDDAESLARGASLEPLSLDELDETQATFEQALAGI